MLYFFFTLFPFSFFWLCVEEKNWIAGNRPGWPSGGITPHKPVWAMAGNDGTTCNGGVFSRPWITKAGDDNGRWPVWFCARIVDGRIPLSLLNSSKSPPPVYIYHRYCCPRPYPGHSSARKRPISAQQRLSLFSVIPLVSNDNKVYALPPSTPLIHFILLFLSLSVSLFTMSGAAQQVDLFNRRHRKWIGLVQWACKANIGYFITTTKQCWLLTRRGTRWKGEASVGHVCISIRVDRRCRKIAALLQLYCLLRLRAAVSFLYYLYLLRRACRRV